MNVSGNTILITGGTSGIGLEFAKSFLGLGNTVIVTGRDKSRLDAILAAHPGLRGIVSDAADPAAITRLHEQVVGEFPAMNVLVNNAGIMRIVGLADPRSLEDVTQEIDIDLAGPIRMVQQFLPDLRTKPNATIVNVSSGLAFVPIPISPIYSAAKAALHAYTRCLRDQLKNSGVSVVEVAPPLTETPLFSDEFKSMMKGAKGMPVDVLVRKAIAGLKAGKTEIRPGQSNALKIFSRIAPGFIFAQMGKVGPPATA
ncbi:SDR family oxidoreductase [uncultured Sphingomonas sp.]|uniref:SDR family oxidoreductase n=1 Tax=uncultured Sphingomonas sp. TaxID=158754 RepID=UPI0035CC69BF